MLARIAMLVVLVGLAGALAACAPVVDGPVERSRAADLVDGDRLALQLRALPGALDARATLHRAVANPLTGESSPASAAILIVTDSHADRTALAATATLLTRAAAPTIAAPTVVVEPRADTPPELAAVGPFRVAPSSRTPLIATFALGLVAIAGLALALALAYRGSSAQ